MSGIFQDIMAKLMAAGIGSPRLETRLILANILQCDANEISESISLTADQQKEAQILAEKRASHQPLDKILGHKEFYKWDFMTNENVLSPRPDTEIILESALQYAAQIKSEKKLRFLDLGTGSGCLILSMLKEFPLAEGIAVDISAPALEVARCNALRLGVADRVRFIQADWFADDFCSTIGTMCGIIVTNPPYIPTNDIAALEDEVKKYDPLSALDGGQSGYDSYIKIAQHTPQLLAENGRIFIEAGIGQARQISEIFEQNGLKLTKIVPDLSGIERCVILQK